MLPFLYDESGQLFKVQQLFCNLKHNTAHSGSFFMFASNDKLLSGTNDMFVKLHAGINGCSQKPANINIKCV